MDREDTIEKEQAGEERARTQVLRAQETGTDYKSTMETLRQAEQELPSFSGSYDDEIGTASSPRAGHGRARTEKSSLARR